MRAVDEAALICDFAETYHILDYQALPVRMQAILACGLREDSRIMMKLSGAKLDLNTVLRAAILDQLAFLAYTKTEDAQKNRNRPESVLKRLTGETEEKNMDIQTFRTGSDFERKWKSLMGDRDGERN